MLEIILIRPGATDFDEQGRIQGNLDIPLSEAGNREVAHTIEALKLAQPEVVYTSESEPSLETAKAIASALTIRLKPLESMKNIDHGLWQGMLIEDVKRKQPKVYRQWQESPETICPPQGEMVSEALERVRAAMGKLLKKHKSGRVALVVPEPLASLVRCYLKQGELGNLWKAETAGGGWESINVEPRALAAAS
jgi:broad specificity phosphatase PhoE